MSDTRIYYNLLKRCLSVQKKLDKGWRVRSYKEIVYLEDVKFKVSEAGRQRVLREKKKNVHAFLEGKETFFDCDIGETTRIYYNPYKSKYFFDRFHQRILKAKQAIVIGDHHGYAIYVKIP